jgi:hypothetical protein
VADSDLTLVETVTPELLHDIGVLRIVAWEGAGERPSLAPSEGNVWTDSHDSHAAHWIYREDERLVAAARLCIHLEVNDLPDQETYRGIDLPRVFPMASLNRLVVSPSYRGPRLSPAFDRVRLQYACERGARASVVVTHLPTRLRDLRRAGFGVLSQSQYRIVSRAPSFILVKCLQ